MAWMRKPFSTKSAQEVSPSRLESLCLASCITWEQWDGMGHPPPKAWHRLYLGVELRYSLPRITWVISIR